MRFTFRILILVPTTVLSVAVSPVLAETPYLVADIEAIDGQGSRPVVGAKLGHELLVVAEAEPFGRELWLVGPHSAPLVEDITPGPESSSLGSFLRVGDAVYFAAKAENDPHGDRLYRTDGTNGAVCLTPGLRDLWGGEVLVGDLLLFAADDGVHGRELWGWDTVTDSLLLLKDIAPGAAGGNPDNLIAAGGRLFFSATDATHGLELWVSDGTPLGTRLVRDVFVGPGGSSPVAQDQEGKAAVGADGTLYFTADDGVHGRELWRTDGTALRTWLVKDVFAGPGGSWPSIGPAVGADGTLYFTADDGVHGRELWRTDGTETGTRLVVDLLPGPEGGDPGTLMRFGTRLLFFDHDSAYSDLWTSDGTAAGTTLLHTFPGGRYSPGYLSVVDDAAYFPAGYDRRLWRTDGTAAGTTLVTEAVQDLGAVVNVEGTVFFTGLARDGPGLWRTDGTAAGTAELWTGSWPFALHVSGGSLFFNADDGIHGRELWAWSRFDDVPWSAPAHDAIEAVAKARVTAGCGGGSYCPDRQATRAQTAVFLLRAAADAPATPPPCSGTVFVDVPPGSSACGWIEELAAEGVTRGCGAGNYCPDAPVTRAQMAVFLLRKKHGAAYTPPTCTGTRFADVPAGSFACGWIEQLAAEGLTSGCDPWRYCPGAPVTRDQMAIFLTEGFDLPLPRP